MTALPKPVRELDRQYMDWVKTLRCRGYVEGDGVNCAGPIDPHHVPIKGGGKMGSKVSDRRCIPLCRAHHERAERNPTHCSIVYECESTIRRLNFEYDALCKPKPKPPRSITPSVKLLLIKCDCGRTHRIGANKIVLSDEDPVEVKYYCGGKTKGWKAAAWG